MVKTRTNALKHGLAASMFMVFLSACDGSGDGVINNMPDNGDTGVANPTDVANPNINVPSGPTHIITGDISLLNDELPIGDINVRVRDTEAQAVRQTDGKFYLAVPASDIDSEVILDFTGENIVEKNIPLKIPAESRQSSINATLASRTPAISFNLNLGGDLQNEGSSTRTTVSVPANAFQFSDGTLATGEAQVSITELDLVDREADFSWVPDFIGLPEGESEQTPIMTFGMSEFHFSQDGRVLDLRPGVSATLSMDLAAPYIVTNEVDKFVDAFEGAVMPLWHYDTDDLVWKEEGDVIITADSESASGFKATGDVSHFSYWNIDVAMPFLMGNIHIRVVDQDQTPRTDVEVLTYNTTVRTPPSLGIGIYNEPPWKNSAVLTPLNNTIQVIGNRVGRADGITLLSMDVLVSNVTTRNHGIISTGVMQQSKVFNEAVGDYSVYFTIVVEDLVPEPELVTSEVFVELVDLDGNARSDLTVSRYTVLVETESDNDYSTISNLSSLRPTLNSQRTVTVVGNPPEFLQSGAEPVTMRITLKQLFVEGGEEVDLINPVSVVRMFNTTNNSRVVLKVPVFDL